MRPGSTVLEVGPGFGFYTFPAARLVGDGRIVCVDVQSRMLKVLERRARRRALGDRIECRRVEDGELPCDLGGQVDLVIAINVVHESVAPARLMAAMARTLRPGGHLLLVEPRGHCVEELFAAEVRWGQAEGLHVVDRTTRRMVWRAVLER